MILIPESKVRIGSSAETRQALAKEFGFHPSLLDDELSAAEVVVPAFYIDEFPVTNGGYAFFLHQTGREALRYWRQTAAPERIDHPAVGVSGEDAEAYAEWSAKQLPTPAQWEAAFQGAALSPRADLLPEQRLPMTESCAAWKGHRSHDGVAGFGEVSEWTSATAFHHQHRFRMLKGPSWMSQAPWSLRKESAIWALSIWGAPFTGFRCVSNVDSTAPCAGSLPSLAEDLLETEDHFLTVPAGTSLAYRGDCSVEIQFTEPSVRIALNCPEGHTMIEPSDVPWFNGSHVENLKATKGAHNRISYSLPDSGLALGISLEAAPDSCTLQYKLANDTNNMMGRCISTCVSLSHEPQLYDHEGTRSYCWLGKGDWLPLNSLPRTTWKECTRWYNGPARSELSNDLSVVLLAVRSRGGTFTFGYGRAGLTEAPRILNNMCFTCLHIDPVVTVKEESTENLNAKLYCIRGDLRDLLQRFKKDFAIR